MCIGREGGQGIKWSKTSLEHNRNCQGSGSCESWTSWDNTCSSPARAYSAHLLLHPGHGGHQRCPDSPCCTAGEQIPHPTVLLRHHPDRANHQPLLQGHIHHRWGYPTHYPNVPGDILHLLVHHDCHHSEHPAFRRGYSPTGNSLLLCSGNWKNVWQLLQLFHSFSV